MSTPGSDLRAEIVWLNANLATMTEGGQPYGAIRDGALAVRGGKLVYVGPRDEMPVEMIRNAPVKYDVQGKWITPGLVDCHTHLIYGGSRAREFELRLQGATYEEIARQGGGIVSTVAATRAADEDELLASAEPRLKAMLAEGVTTIEIKSGYGLDLETEMRMLRVAARLGEEFPVEVVPTFLGAHALPREYADKPDKYIDLVCAEVIPLVAESGLARAVDAFCETIGFSISQTERVFEAASREGLPVKLHAEQLSDMGGATLAARYSALSADHLEYLSQDGARAMAEAGTVAVLLPGAYYFIRETHLPPIGMMRRAGLDIALATDCNPGTSPTTSPLLMLNMACTLFRLTPEEALAGLTRNGARALGLGRTKGVLQVGRDADFVIWNITEPAELAYRFGFNPAEQVVRMGAPR